MVHPVIDRLQYLWNQSTTAKNILKVYLGNILSSVIAFSSTLILIRGLHIADYAYYVVFISVATFGSGIVGSGINMALVRFSADYFFRTNKRPYALYWLSLFVQTAIFLFLMAIGFLLTDRFCLLLFGDANLVKPFRFGIIYGLGLLLLEVGRSFYQAEERFNFYIGALGLGRLLLLVLIIGASVAHVLTFEVVAGLTAAVYVVMGFGIIYSSLLHGNLSSFRAELDHGRESLHQFVLSTGWMIGYFLILAAFSRMDIFMLSRLASDEELAVYGVAFQYYSMVLLLLASIHTVLLPLFSRSEMQAPARQQLFLVKWLKYTVWGIIPILVFKLVGRQPFIWISGSRYERSFEIFMILSIGIWLSLMFSPLINILISRKQFLPLFSIGLGGFLVNIVSNYFLVPLLGGGGAAIAVVLSNASINLMAAIKAGRFRVS
jgi:O-antigen/teichoic acid export membrane protein